MKRFVFVLTCLSIIFSSYSYAKQANYYEKQGAKQKTQINKIASNIKPFITPHLNTEPRVTNKKIY